LGQKAWTGRFGQKASGTIDAHWLDSAGMQVGGTIRLLTATALLAATFALGGCSTQIADLPAVGLPSDAPPRPKEAGGYLPVHDLPPDRADSAMNIDEQKRIQAELIAARDRQAASGTPAATPSR
jgi:hypothetical protein